MNSRQDFGLLDTILSHPILSKEEIVELCAKDCRDELVQHNFRLVFYIAKRWQGRGLDFDDLFQYGVLGLMTAARKYDPEKNDNFSAYASHWIKAAIRRGLYSSDRDVRIPEYRRRSATFNAWLFAPPVEIDNPDNRFHTTYPDPQTVEDEIANAELALTASIALNKLRPKERNIITKRYGFGNSEPQTYAEIADTLGMTRQGVQQSEARALRRLRCDPILQRRTTT